MTAQIIILFEIWRFYDFLVFFSKHLDIKKLIELEFLNPIVRCCQGTFMVANLVSKYDCSNLFGFRIIAFS